MTARHELHGLTLAVAADDPAVADAVLARLRNLPPADPSAADDLTFTYRSCAAPDRSAVPDEPGRPVYNPPLGTVLHYDAADEMIIDYGGRVRVRCRSSDGRATIEVGPEEQANLWFLSRPMFTLPLLEMAKRRARYGLHSGAVSRDGAGILLPGHSGAGKSTLTLALVAAGLSFVSDDLVFLARDDDDGVTAFGLPDDIDLTPQTAALLPDVAEAMGPVLDGWPKRALAPGEALRAEIVPVCRPEVLVLPRISGRPESTLEPVPAGEVLVELAPNVMLTEPRSAQAHLDALAALVTQCRCLRLHTGTDLHAAARLVAGLLD